MSRPGRCPGCGERMHPFAAGCPTCGADLDAARRQQAVARPWQHAALPSIRRDRVDVIVPAVVLLLLALYAPLLGAVFSLVVAWHGHHNALVARRNIAAVCVALAVFDLLAPGVLLSAMTI